MKLIFTFLSLLCTAALAQNPLWLRYPSISPDGSQIAFTYQGDLYTVSTSGGKATPITVHPAHDFMPVWMPDGKTIAFASDRFGNFDIYTISAQGGLPMRLTYHSSNDFPTSVSPDGKNILFNSTRVDLDAYADFPNRAMPELYSVPIEGGRNNMVLTTPSEAAVYNASATKIYYQDRKGYEDPWRKHHQSSIARDLWVYDAKNGTHTQLTTFAGEDRNPMVDAQENFLYYLSEEKGSFNVYRLGLKGSKEKTQLTDFSKHPVRFLSLSSNGILCFSYDGEIYTLRQGEQPRKVDIKIQTETKLNPYEIVPVNSGATELAISPNGKEVAFVVRGEIFVTSVEGGATKRITNTPEQERSVNFSKDGRNLVYAGERNNNWNVYKTSIVRKEEPYFYASTVLKEEPVVATDAEEFQPEFSPDGKEVAYLENRTTLRVANLASKAVRTILPGNKNYSYSDGDQYYSWSPDGKWFLVDYLLDNHWIGEVGLVSSAGNSEVINLTKSGYNDGNGRWMMKGKMMLWFSDRDGMKNHGSWGASTDVYGMFFTQEAYDRFRLSEVDYKLLKEKEDKEKEKDKDKDKAKDEKADDKNKTKPVTKEEEKSDAIVIDLNGLEDRKAKLTIHSSLLNDAIISPDGEKLYYLARIEKGIDLWTTNLRTRETKILTKLGDNAGALNMSGDGKKLYVLVDGKPNSVDAESGKKETMSINGEMQLFKQQELAYIFDHSWRQMLEKFYVADMQGVDWRFYKKEYAKFLPHISNNWEFAEMLSEMLGELNASHTGCRYSPDTRNGDQTASLGLIYDENFSGNGIRISSVLKKGPFDRADSKVKKGTIIEKIDDDNLSSNSDIFKYLNRKAGKNTLITLYDPTTKNRWEEVIKPVGIGQEIEMLYRRWVERRAAEVDSLSRGKVGYIHVRGMNDPSYRTVYEEALGKHANKESLIVDTRSNGGGWLHEDLSTFLSGKKYLDVIPRGQYIGFEPQFKWTKPSAVLIGESNYSDAHMFPFAYDAKSLGMTVGMPIPGTGTAVWWEQQIDPTLVFGIPQVGMVGADGKYLENTQLEPTYKVKNHYEMLVKGRDEQIEKAVELLVQRLAEKPAPNKIVPLEKKGN
ncbi:MAG TPA: S41 family peptidase [Cyclobacteriaceae bacterium]|nr:S41 family peptidase [Cyclobacteriaceae bacterium]